MLLSALIWNPSPEEAFRLDEILEGERIEEQRGKNRLTELLDGRLDRILGLLPRCTLSTIL